MSKSAKVGIAIFVIGLAAGLFLKNAWFGGSYKAYCVIYIMVAACVAGSIILVKTKKKRRAVRDEYVQPRKMTLK